MVRICVRIVVSLSFTQLMYVAPPMRMGARAWSMARVLYTAVV